MSENLCFINFTNLNHGLSKGGKSLETSQSAEGAFRAAPQEGRCEPDRFLGGGMSRPSTRNLSN